jgi:hypothetical protein
LPEQFGKDIGGGSAPAARGPQERPALCHNPPFFQGLQAAGS